MPILCFLYILCLKGVIYLRAIFDSYKIMAILLSRNPLFWLLSIGFISYNYLGLRTFSSGVDFSPGEGLIRMSFAVQAGILIFLFLGVLFTRIEGNSNLEEVLHTIPNAAKNKFIGKLLFFVTLTLLLTIIVWFIYYSLFSARGITFSSFYIHAFYYMILFWSLTFFISLLVGILLSTWIKNKLVYPLILLVWILIGPVNIYFLGGTSQGSFISNLFVWMNLGEPNPTALFNDLYGFELSNYHWIKKALIISVISLFIYITFCFKKTFIKRTKQLIITTSCLLIIIIGLSFSLGLERQPYYSNPYSSLSRDDVEYNYYGHLIDEKTTLLNKHLQINNYDIALDVDRNVKVKTTFNLENNSMETTDSLMFTLYHGFKVKNIAIDNQKVTFKQDKDLLTLTLEKPLEPNKNTDITMVYEGLSSPLFFANERSIYLPYYFPWLPSLNTERAFVVTDKYGLLRENHQWNQPTYVTLKFSGPHELFTNLVKGEDGNWSGTVDKGLSVIAGELDEISTDTHTLIEPTGWLVNKNLFPDFKSKLEDIFIFANKTYGLKEITLPEQIYFIPTLSISDFSNEDLVWYAKDHLIYGSYLMHNETFIQNESFLAYDIFPAITWKTLDGETTTNREYYKLFSDITAYLYNQIHSIEDSGELIDQSQAKEDIVRNTKNKVIKWILSDGNFEGKVQFTNEWFQLIQNGKTDWNSLNQLAAKFIE